MKKLFLKMVEEVWMRWCRLCTREDGNINSHIDLRLRDEESLPLFDTIYKCFSIDIKCCDNFPSVICYDCYCLLRMILKLTQRIPKATAMFTELFVKSEEELDPYKIKNFHNLDCDLKLFNQSSRELDEQINPNPDQADNNCDNYLHSSADEQIDTVENVPNRIKKYKSRKSQSVENRNKPHYCSKCEKGFIKFCNYRQHMKIVHETTLENKHPVFVCGKCGKKCRSLSSLKEHEFSHSEERTFKCKNCEKAFKSITSLKQHEDTHNETRYICVVCGLQLNTQQTLRKHMIVHSDEKKYKCDYCGNGYKRVKALKAHLILHTGLRPYSCDFCDKTFANVSNCRGHKKKVHPIELAALEASGQVTVSTTVIPKLDELRAITANKVKIITGD
ncbi:zinc finger protein 239-like [Eupeodes corollae]|uniref:zinc finger protein 239-like n=1 Tax=Eupeodes corollae TaxID=290404 RepID=UPI0024918CFD|nr:zinc finger protein 239-like [Eupeodes corollae]